MGPLAYVRRVHAMQHMIADAVSRIRTGGARMGNQGFFFEPTVLTDVPDEGVEEASRSPYGLAAYAGFGADAIEDYLNTKLVTQANA